MNLKYIYPMLISCILILSCSQKTLNDKKLEEPSLHKTDKCRYKLSLDGVLELAETAFDRYLFAEEERIVPIQDFHKYLTLASMENTDRILVYTDTSCKELYTFEYYALRVKKATFFMIKEIGGYRGSHIVEGFIYWQNQCEEFYFISTQGNSKRSFLKPVCIMKLNDRFQADTQIKLTKNNRAREIYVTKILYENSGRYKHEYLLRKMGRHEINEKTSFQYISEILSKGELNGNEELLDARPLFETKNIPMWNWRGDYYYKNQDL